MKPTWRESFGTKILNVSVAQSEGVVSTFKQFTQRTGLSRRSNQSAENMSHLEKIDGKGAAKHAVGHGALHARMYAGPNLHQLAHAPLEALPQLQNHALLAGAQLQALVNLQVGRSLGGKPSRHMGES